MDMPQRRAYENQYFVMRKARRNRENLFQLERTAPASRIVENRDAGNFGNGVFEQLQPLYRLVLEKGL